VKACRWCKQQFEPKTENQISCSPKCTAAYWAWKRLVARIMGKRKKKYGANSKGFVTRAAVGLAAAWLAEKRRIVQGIRVEGA
jgi:hypothetical protein